MVITTNGYRVFEERGKTAAAGEDDTRKIVTDMPGVIDAVGETMAREYAEKLYGLTQGNVGSREEIEVAVTMA